MNLGDAVAALWGSDGFVESSNADIFVVCHQRILSAYISQLAEYRLYRFKVKIYKG